jgi:hypothetical protein
LQVAIPARRGAPDTPSGAISYFEAAHCNLCFLFRVILR